VTEDYVFFIDADMLFLRYAPPLQWHAL